MSKFNSRFVLTNTNLLSTGFGRLTPFYMAEVNPGDRLSISDSFQVQMVPLISPAFQDCRMYVHHYFVPSRILHINEEYNAWVSREQRKLATLSSAPVSRSVTSIGDMISALNNVYRNNSSGSLVPFLTDRKAVLNLLPDYLRIQFSSAADYSANKDSIIIEPFVACFKIFIDHYVSTLYPTFFIDSTTVNGDYNYVALTYEDLVYLFSWFQKNGYDYILDNTITLTLPSSKVIYPLRILLQVAHVMYGRKGDQFMEAYPVADYAAGSQPVGSTIEDLRLNSAMTKYKEKKALVGKGVASFFWEFFNVKASDNRLQFSRFLGGGRSQINIDDVPQTSETTDDSALAQLGGNAWKKSSFGHGRRYFDDYGYTFGFVYFLPKQSYFNGVDQIWYRRGADDLYLSDFDSIGDEPVFTRELTFSNSGTVNDTVIGYQPRYQRYKRVKNEIHGDFCDSLMYFHQSRNIPLNTNLAEIRQCFAKPQGLNRVFNYNGVTSEASPQPIWVYVKVKAKWRRNMRYKSKPKIS